MSELKLYYTESCPYCHKVKTFAESNNIDLIYKNIAEDQKNQEELLSIGGKTQVPCLFIDGKPLYESDDIIAWLTDNAM